MRRMTLQSPERGRVRPGRRNLRLGRLRQLAHRAVHERREIRPDHRWEEGRWSRRAAVAARRGDRSAGANHRRRTATTSGCRSSPKDGSFIKTLAAPSRGGLVVLADGTIYVSDVNAGRGDGVQERSDLRRHQGRRAAARAERRSVNGDVYTSSSNGDSPNVTKAVLKKATK